MTKSMTAFARVASDGDWGQASWELRTINHRYLDINLRLPEALRQLENKVREVAAQYCKRGKLDCGLRFQAGAQTAAVLQVNDGLVSQLGKACQDIGGHLSNAAAVDPARLLSYPGVVRLKEADMGPVEEKVLALLHEGFTSLLEVRKTEGGELRDVTLARVKGIHVQLAIVKEQLPIIQKEVRERILKRFEELGVAVDTQRVEQEMVLLLQKMDVAEELNREVNTLGSKSQDVKVTGAMVEMKVLIEQMREQIQNLE